MFYLEIFDRVFDHGQRAYIRCVQHVGNVSMYKDVAGLEPEDGGLWYARVGTAQPEDFGGLAFGEGGEEVRVAVGTVCRPGFVAGEGGVEGVWR